MLKKSKKIQFISIFILLFTIIGIFPFSIYLYSKYTESIHSRDKYISLQREFLKQINNRINSIHLNVLKDLDYLSTSYNFKKYIKSGSAKEIVIDDWLLLSRLSGKYDQIRYIDEKGMEKLRINNNNGNPSSVEKKDLQDKSKRYYFKEVAAFKDPQILVSYLDLNIENGKIEKPLKPMLRYSAPIYSKEGIFKGVVMINYLAENIFNMLRDESDLYNNNIYLINPDGYILYGPDSSKAWGFMYEDKKDLTIFNDPNLPDDFNKEIHNINNNIFIQRVIYLNSINNYKVLQMDKFWVLVTESREVDLRFNNIFFTIFSSLWHIIIIFLIASIIITYSLTYLISKVISLRENRGILRKVMNEVVNALEVTSILDDDDTGNHIKRVCRYSYTLARAFGLPESQSRSIMELASLHDIGKVGVHDSILKKKGPLTPYEWNEMKKHVIYGSEVIKRTDLSSVAYNIVLYHHENWDGTGYTEGLSNTGIPIEARIVALADVYDALRTRRCYKDAMSHEQAISVILKESGKKFDPDLVTAFLYSEDKFNEISVELK